MFSFPHKMQDILGLPKSELKASQYTQVLTSFSSGRPAGGRKRTLKEYEKLQQELTKDEMETFGLLIDHASVGAGSKASKKARKWRHEEFRQSSRDGQYRLNRWCREDASDEDYFASKEVKKKYPTKITFTDVESEKFKACFEAGRKKYKWLEAVTIEEVQDIIRTLLSTEVRFIVVADRFDRTVEEVKLVFYAMEAEWAGEPMEYNPEVEKTRKEMKGEVDEKARIAELRKWQAKLKEVKEVLGSVDKGLEADKGRGVEKKTVVFFSSEEQLELPPGMTKKFPEAKAKLGGWSQRVKQLSAEVVELAEKEKQLKALVKTLTVVAKSE
jgi:hypothetical protein